MNFSIKRLELFVWLLVPGAISFLLLIICLVPKHMWGFSYVVPLLPLIPVFFWGRLQTIEIPYILAALLGLFTDAVSSAPLGISAMLYLLFLMLAHMQGRYINKESFMMSWAYFAMLVGMVSLGHWLVMSLLAGKLYAFMPAFVQWLFTIGVYPLFHKLFEQVAEFVKQRRWIILHG